MNKATNRKIARAVSAWLTMAILAAAAIALAGCQNDTETTPPIIIPVTREFPLTLSGKPITLIDRTGNSSSLEVRGILDKFQTASNMTLSPDATTKINNIYNAGGKIVIYVDAGAYYEYGKTSGHSISLHQNYIISKNANIIKDDIENELEYVMTVSKAIGGAKVAAVEFLWCTPKPDHTI